MLLGGALPYIYIYIYIYIYFLFFSTGNLLCVCSRCSRISDSLSLHVTKQDKTAAHNLKSYEVQW